MRFIFLAILLLTNFLSKCQTRLINNKDCFGWDRLTEIGRHSYSLVSPNGKHFSYKVENDTSNKVFLSNINGSILRSISNTNTEGFNKSGSFFSVISGYDSLIICRLLDNFLFKIPNVRYHKIITNELAKTDYVLYVSGQNENELHLLNLTDSTHQVFLDVKEYSVTNGLNDVILCHNNGFICHLNSNFSDLVKIDSVSSPQSLALSYDDKKLAVYYGELDDFKIRIYNLNIHQQLGNIHSELLQVGKSLTSRNIRFSPDGSKLFFEVVNLSRPSDKELGSLKIWNFKSLNLGPSQIGSESTSQLYYVNIQPYLDIDVKALTSDSTLLVGRSAVFKTNNFVIIRNKINLGENYWKSEKPALFIMDLGSNKVIFSKLFERGNFLHMELSPNERFAIWYDSLRKSYFTFDLVNHVECKIGNDIPTDLYASESQIPARRKNYGICGWSGEDSCLLIYDRYDIWLVDPGGIKKSIRVTNSNRDMVFRLAYEDELQYGKLPTKILLSTFSEKTKKNGFASLDLNNLNLHVFNAGNYVYNVPPLSPAYVSPTFISRPVLINKTGEYLITRMSSTASLNLYLTKDLVKFKQVTNISPERSFNWMTSELISYVVDTTSLNGIIYKPQNFNPNSKYPVIVSYYERQSNGLNFYRTPSLSEGTLSIPWYVSNGYIVYLIDVSYQTGNTAKAFFNSLNIACDTIIKRRWVDSTRIGLQGHSFGGFETLVAISYTNRFRAAQESNGYANSISYYGFQINGSSSNRNDYYDNDQGNLGCPPWICPETYIKNSPLFYISKVNTPVLILHNHGDTNVPFSQASEYFSALRRMNRSSWLLDYGDNEDHVIIDISNKIDFTNKQQAFFNHYLMNQPMPIWMKE